MSEDKEKKPALDEAEESKTVPEKNGQEDEGVVIISAEDSSAPEQDDNGSSAKPSDSEPESESESVKDGEEDAPQVKEDKPSKHEKKAEPKKEKPRKKEPKKDPNKKEYLPDFPYDFKTVLGVLFAISILMFIWSVFFNPSMRIDHIDIRGNYEFSDDRIMDSLGVHPGDHIFTPVLFNAMALERSTPYIEDIDVRLDFPSGLIIDVTERHRLAYIKVPDGYAVIDDEGVILDFCTFDAGDVHPVLCGLDLDSVVIGTRTDITESLKFRKLILVLGAVLDADRGSIRNDGYHFFDSVQEIRVVSSGLIFLTVELPDGTLLQVKLAGVENIDDNMQWLLYAIRADAFEGLPAGSLDMTQDEKIYRAYSS